SLDRSRRHESSANRAGRYGGCRSSNKRRQLRRSAEDGRLVFAHAGNTLRPPASDEKLLLSMALLDRFGAHYRIPTRVEGPRPKHGLVRRNLWLVGHGDPELNDAALARLARKLRATGIRAVRGSV